jgi:subtilisin family serine protease
MKHSFIAFLFAVLAAPVFAPAVKAQAPEQGSPSANLQNLARNSFIFRFDDGVSPGQARGRAAALVSQAGGQLGHVYTNTIKGFSTSMSSVAADNLFRQNADVVGYTRDGVASIVQATPTRGKPVKTPKDGGGSAAEVTPWGITRVGGPVSSGGRACVIDTGVDLDNPDLNVNVSKSRSFISSGKSANSPDDYQGHGTHVAGTIAAIDNDIDVVGVAAGAEVVSIRVLDQRGSGLWSWIIAGIDYSASETAKCDVANLSLGGSRNTAVDAAVVKASEKVKFAIAAGNSGADANNYSPARVNGVNIHTVSAINSSDDFASWSNWGNPPVDFAAPGVSVLSLKRGGGVTTKSGTSMAAPHVAGILLLGGINTDGNAIGDPDGNADPIAHR